MKRKFVLAAFSFALCGICFISATEMNESPGGKAGYTGAPSESTCAKSGCHDSYALNSSLGSLTISSTDLTNWEYVPGQTYTISVTVAQSGKSLFGVCFEALKSNGDNAGTLVAGTGTHISSKTVGSYSRKSINQNQGGGASSNSHTFTFTWQAPATDVGDITFYASGDACNGNGNELGDYVYTKSQVVGSLVGVYEIDNVTDRLNVYPNPVNSDINIATSLASQGIAEYNLFDGRGALVKPFGKFDQGASEVIRTFDVSDLATGTYMLQLKVNGQLSTTKIIQKL